MIDLAQLLNTNRNPTIEIANLNEDVEPHQGIGLRPVSVDESNPVEEAISKRRIQWKLKPSHPKILRYSSDNIALEVHIYISHLVIKKYMLSGGSLLEIVTKREAQW